MISVFVCRCAIVAALTLAAMIFFPLERCEAMEATEGGRIIRLPSWDLDGSTSIEKSLAERRSVRSYGDEDVTIGELSQLLWAAQGVTNRRGFRTAPSAGALYPLEVVVVAGRVSGLAPGVYRYGSADHELVKTIDGDRRVALWQAGLEQSAIRNAPVILVFCAVYERTTLKYGERGIRYVHMEAGHAAQNVCLQAISLRLGTVVIGAFHDKQVKHTLELKTDESPLVILPVGKVRAKN
jgi:SagB-type dehydrogenase family enzyme